MNLTRHDLAAAGVFALGTTTLILPAMAATDDEEAVKQAVEALRKAMLTQDKAKLETLTAEQLSYSHSDARLEDKAKFIDAIMTRKAVIKSIDFPELTVAIAGNNAIVRHLWLLESELDGKVTNTKIGVADSILPICAQRSISAVSVFGLSRRAFDEPKGYD